jgi:hypothetical protein
MAERREGIISQVVHSRIEEVHIIILQYMCVLCTVSIFVRVWYGEK